MLKPNVSCFLTNFKYYQKYIPKFCNVYAENIFKKQGKQYKHGWSHDRIDVMKIVAFLENAVKAIRQLSVFIYAFFFVNDFVFPKKGF